MKSSFYLALAILIALVNTRSECVGAEANIESTSRDILVFEEPSGWNTGIFLKRSTREYKTDADVLDLDIDHLLFRLGASPLPFLNLWAEAGMDRAKRLGEDGESGFQWGAGGYARIADFPWDVSPVVGAKNNITIGVDFSYSNGESNFDAADFSWREWQVSPLVSYISNRKGDYRWFSFEPDAIAIRGGPVFVSTDGDYGDSSIEENRNFGGQMKFDLLWSSGWTTLLDLKFFGSEEREIGIGITRNF